MANEAPYAGGRLVLVGRYASPYVRRVALCMRFQRIGYDLLVTSPLTEPDRVRSFNPMGRVPVLTLPDGRRLIESAAIIDHLDELAPPDRRVVPAGGALRVDVLQMTAAMTNACEKAIYAVYERTRRPEEKRHEPFRASLLDQVAAGLALLEAQAGGGWLVGDRVTLADITVAVGWRFLKFAAPELALANHFPILEAHAARCEATDEFSACQPETYGDVPAARGS